MSGPSSPPADSHMQLYETQRQSADMETKHPDSVLHQRLSPDVDADPKIVNVDASGITASSSSHDSQTQAAETNTAVEATDRAQLAGCEPLLKVGEQLGPDSGSDSSIVVVSRNEVNQLSAATNAPPTGVSSSCAQSSADALKGKPSNRYD